jgi:hypothetical protein
MDNGTSLLAGLLAVTNLLYCSPQLPPVVYFRLPTKILVRDLSNNSPIGVQYLIEKDFDLTQGIRDKLKGLRGRAQVYLVSTAETLNSDLDEYLALAQDEATLQEEKCIEDPLEFARVSGISSSCIGQVERKGLLVVGGFRPIIRSDLYIQLFRIPSSRMKSGQQESSP